MASHWLDSTDTLRAVLSVSGQRGLISDFDGTLSPFAVDPPAAALHPAAALLLDRLHALGLTIALVSGRGAADLRDRFPRPWAVYYGNHGLESWSEGDVQMTEAVRGWVDPLRALLDAFGPIGIPGAFVENKGATASVHYRKAADVPAARAVLEQRLAPLCAQYGFVLSEGQMIWEIKPPVQLNKGTAALTVVELYRLDGVVFIGDDVTDFTAMDALRDAAQNGRLHAACVGVLHPTSPPDLTDHCDCIARGVEDVMALLTWMTDQVINKN